MDKILKSKIDESLKIMLSCYTDNPSIRVPDMGTNSIRRETNELYIHLHAEESKKPLMEG